MEIIVVDNLNLHETKDAALVDYNEDFEKNCDFVSGEHSQSTNKRYKNIEAYETYVNNTVWDYDADDFFSMFGFINYIHLKLLRLIDLQMEKAIITCKILLIFWGKKCYVPSSGSCFIKNLNYLWDRILKKEFLSIIRDEKRRSKIMTSAGVEPFFALKTKLISVIITVNKSIDEIFIERNRILYLHENHFFWK